MPKLIPETVQRQLDGLTNMTAHARRLFQMGVYDRSDLHKIEAFEAEQRGHIADTETYAAMREDGTWDKLEQVLNDSRAGTAAERELLARKTAAHYIAEQALEHQPRSQEEQNAVMKGARERMAEFIDMSGADSDNDFAIFETKAKLDLRDAVEKPKPDDYAKFELHKITDDDAHARDFQLRMEGTKGSKQWNDSHDGAGVKRAADGRIISERTLRSDADRAPKKQKILNDLTKETGSDRGDGFTADHEFGVQSASDAEQITRFEQERANDAAAAAEASPPPPSDPGPVTLPNSLE